MFTIYSYYRNDDGGEIQRVSIRAEFASKMTKLAQEVDQIKQITPDAEVKITMPLSGSNNSNNFQARLLQRRFEPGEPNPLQVEILTQFSEHKILDIPLEDLCSEKSDEPKTIFTTDLVEATLEMKVSADEVLSSMTEADGLSFASLVVSKARQEAKFARIQQAHSEDDPLFTDIDNELLAKLEQVKKSFGQVLEAGYSFSGKERM